MEENNNKRIALITGGASGLGLATAQRLAREGMTVVVGDLNAKGSEQVAAALPGVGHLGLRLDISDEASVSAGFEQIEQELGPVSVLVNFAGVMGEGPDGERITLQEMDLANWESVFAVNARGSFLCVREMIRWRARQPVEHGRIVLISSAAAQLGSARASASYCASKGAVLSLVKTAAREFAEQGITINAVAPGGIDTPMLRRVPGAPAAGEDWKEFAGVPLGRVGQPEEVAAAVAYLCSVEAAYVTGATLDVNGGLRMQ